MRENTKTALMDVAERAVRARGFDGFSYADLAEAVGIRKASIHHHFPTKANLSEALMDRYHALHAEICADIDADHQTGAARLSALVDHYRGALDGGQIMCLCVAFAGSRDSLSEPLKAKISAFRAMMLAWIAGCFERGRGDQSIGAVSDPQSEACAALALLEGAHLAARAEEDVAVFDRAVSLFKARLTS